MPIIDLALFVHNLVLVMGKLCFFFLSIIDIYVLDEYPLLILPYLFIIWD